MLDKRHIRYTVAETCDPLYDILRVGEFLLRIRRCGECASVVGDTQNKDFDTLYELVVKSMLRRQFEM